MSVLAVDGRKVGYELRGSGPPIVLCHSLGGNRSLYAAQLDALATEHTVLAFDMRGHGETALGERPPSLQALADDVLGLLDALGLGDAHVVGQSIGGMTALALAVRAPRQVVSYVVLDAVAYSDAAWDTRYAERAARVERDGLEPLALELATRSLGAATHARDPRLRSRYAAVLAAAPRAGYAWACRAMIGFDLRPALAAVRAPMLVAAGAEDELTPPSEARAIAAAVPGAELAEIDGSGHVPCIERPDAVATLIREWVAAQRPGGALRPEGARRPGGTRRPDASTRTAPA